MPASHVSYVGHASLTDRLLEVDLEWNWEPLAVGVDGLPALDELGGLWIKLTVCGVTRLGYGDSGTKRGCDAVKEKIGDALRNAAMRFGAALDLWSKGDLQPRQEEEDVDSDLLSDRDFKSFDSRMKAATNIKDLKSIWEEAKRKCESLNDEPSAKILKEVLIACGEKINNKSVYCSDEKFTSQKDGWRELIVSGKRTVADLIAMVETTEKLTDEQKNTVDSWSHEND